jgi:hypothetical protein
MDLLSALAAAGIREVRFQNRACVEVRPRLTLPLLIPNRL